MLPSTGIGGTVVIDRACERKPPRASAEQNKQWPQSYLKPVTYEPGLHLSGILTPA